MSSPGPDADHQNKMRAYIVEIKSFLTTNGIEVSKVSEWIQSTPCMDVDRPDDDGYHLFYNSPDEYYHEFLIRMYPEEEHLQYHLPMLRVYNRHILESEDEQHSDVDYAGCLWCTKVYPKTEVKEFVDLPYVPQTAVCPFCNKCYVIPGVKVRRHKENSWEAFQGIIEAAHKFWCVNCRYNMVMPRIWERLINDDAGLTKEQKVLALIDRVQGYMIVNGFTVEESKRWTEDWREEPSEMLLHQPVKYWYYRGIGQSDDFFSCNFHSHRLDNSDKIRFDDEAAVDFAGCMWCCKVFKKTEVTKFIPTPGDSQATAACPHCDTCFVVPGFEKSRFIPEPEEWLQQQLEKAHQFWFTHRQYSMV